jgi:NAD(P)-dependent dehydrogenase (short-subunit alcohol dehydrogenase family)
MGGHTLKSGPSALALADGRAFLVDGSSLRVLEPGGDGNYRQVGRLENVKSTFFLSQHAARLMIARGRGGRIVNLSSQAAVVALPGEPVYCLAKAAVSHLTRCLAVEWGEHGITVNAVAPTFIETPGTAPALGDAAFRADTVSRIAALHRIGKPVEVAGAVVFLASPAASLVTGHTLVIDGGWTVR